MKKNKPLEPMIIVSEKVLGLLATGFMYFIDIPIDDKFVDYLPPPYESADHTILIFPANECPEWVYFKEEGKNSQIIGRKIMNVMAYKKEDGSEIIRIRMMK